MRLLDQEAVHAVMRGEHPHLTPSERREVVRLLAAKGVGTKQIAGLLGILESSVCRIKRPRRGNPQKAKAREGREPLPSVPPPPPPTVCECKCLRIQHKGGGECRGCSCLKFRNQVEGPPVTILAGRIPSLSVRTMQARERTAHGLRLIAGGMPVAMAARESGTYERALYRALEARRKAA